MRFEVGVLHRNPYGPGVARGTLAHAVRFATWQSLEADGLDDAAKADLVVAWLD